MQLHVMADTARHVAGPINRVRGTGKGSTRRAEVVPFKGLVGGGSRGGGGGPAAPSGGAEFSEPPKAPKKKI